jgi:hypothetical protein
MSQPVLQTGDAGLQRGTRAMFAHVRERDLGDSPPPLRDHREPRESEAPGQDSAARATSRSLPAWGRLRIARGSSLLWLMRINREVLRRPEPASGYGGVEASRSGASSPSRCLAKKASR